MASQLTFLSITLALTIASGYQFTTRLRLTKDVTLERGSRNYNYLPFLLVGYHPPWPNKRSLLQFTNPPYLCRRVLYARLHLYFVYAHKASFMSSAQIPLFSRRIVAHRVLKSWIESQATSTKRYHGAYWSKKLLRLGSDAVRRPTSYGVTINPRRRGWYSLDVTSAVRAWKRGSPNYGLLIRATNEYRRGRDFRFASNRDRNRARFAYITVRCQSQYVFPWRKPGSSGRIRPQV